jgi:hypothetical protein
MDVSFKLSYELLLLTVVEGKLHGNSKTKLSVRENAKRALDDRSPTGIDASARRAARCRPDQRAE